MPEQTKKHIVVLALSDLKPYPTNPDVPRSYPYEVSGFEEMGLPNHYDAWHTNEAPIKLLIDLAVQREQPIDRIVYLLSDKCEHEKEALGEDSLTAEEYFKRKVCEHLTRCHATDWLSHNEDFFYPVSYKPSDPGSSLVDIIAALGTNATVDVDVSGAQRDALFLLSHTIEFMQTATTGAESIELGTTVFASLIRGTSPNMLTRQDDTYALFSLVNGVDSFIRYGRADMLVAAFGNSTDTAAGRLCHAMQCFSDNLQLCRMTAIPELLDDIRQKLDAYESWLSQQDTPSSSELLFGTLIPAIRADFVHTTNGNRALYLIEIIRWCVERQMLQQALALYRESACQIMLLSRYLTVDNTPSGEELIECVGSYAISYLNNLKNLVGPLIMKNQKRVRVRAYRAIAFQDDKGKNSRVKPIEGTTNQLTANLLWFFYLVSIRNEIVHARKTDAKRRLNMLEQSIATFDDAEAVCMDYDLVRENEPDAKNKALAHDILKALEGLEGKLSLRVCDELAAIPTSKPAEIPAIVESRTHHAKDFLAERKPQDSRSDTLITGERQHYILCVLSNPHENASEYSYELFGPMENIVVKGTQTNDAPVRCLITLAERANDPITHIIYLASDECRKSFTANGRSLMLETHFREMVKEHFDSLGLTGKLNPTAQDEFFIPLDYAHTPTERLGELIDSINKEDALFDVDLTGGPRDAALLISMCTRFMETKYLTPFGCSSHQYRVGMGTSLYSNFQEKTLYRQDSTFELMDLLSGVSSFTEYGNAEVLVGYFMADTTATPISPEMLRLCNAMSHFSNDLAVCRMTDIDKQVQEIHESLDAFEENASSKSSRYTMIQKQIKENSSSSEHLTKKLEENRMRRGELLFLSLVPRFRSEFVANPTGLSDMERLLNLIQWCTNRRMLQQALSIFKEKVPEYLEDAGYVMWTSEETKKTACITNLAQGKTRDKNGNYNPESATVNEQKRDEYVELLAAATEDRFDRKWLAAIACALYPQETVNPNKMTIPAQHAPTIRSILIWYYYLNDIRNRVMHADSPRDSADGGCTRQSYREVIQFLGRAGVIEGDLRVLEYSFGDTSNICNDLARDISLALKALEGSIVIEPKQQGAAFRLKIQS